MTRKQAYSMSFVGFIVFIVVCYVLYSLFGKKIMKYTGISDFITSVWTFLGFCESPGRSPPREINRWTVPWYITSQLNGINEHDYPNHVAAIKQHKDKFTDKVTKILDNIYTERDKNNSKLIDEWNVKSKAYTECKIAQAKVSASNAISSTLIILINSTASHLGPWLAFIVMIISFIIFSVYLAKSSSEPSSLSSSYSVPEPPSLYMPFWLSNLISRSKSLLRRYTKLFAISHSEDGQQRPAEGGRCGNEWVDNKDPASSNTCLNTVSPPDIKTKFTENGSPVYIPWLVQDTFFVPQCESSYIINDNDEKVPTEKTYYIDNGLTCSPETKDRVPAK